MKRRLSITFYTTFIHLNTYTRFIYTGVLLVPKLLSALNISSWLHMDRILSKLPSSLYSFPDCGLSPAFQALESDAHLFCNCTKGVHLQSNKS